MWQTEDALKCGGCGHPLDETTDNNERASWIAEKVICWACAANERQSTADHDNGGRPAPGTKYRTRSRAWD